MVSDTKNSVPEPTPQETQAGQARTADQQPPRRRNLARRLLFATMAIVAIALAAWSAVVVALGTHLTTAHRAAAAWTALLVVAALAILAQVILTWYQAQLSAPLDQPPWTSRRRGLKAAVMGQDGRASTSKTQVVLWTAAVVWALVDLLLLARAYPRGSLFTNAVTIANTLGVNRVYMREPAGPEVQGFMAGVAELFTGDDDAVDWADLQYVAFTLITLVYFAAQFLAQPTDGLPAVPAALLTLMGVSASGYTANKIVNTKVNTQEAPVA